MKKISLVLALSLVLLFGLVMQAVAFQQFELPAGSVEASGLPVSAKVRFTIDDAADTIHVDLWNTIVNPTSIAQNISDLFFALTTGQTTGTLSSSLGLNRTVDSGGDFLDGSEVSTGWVLLSTATGFKLDGLGTAADVPAHTIIGKPDAGGVYSNANASIAGNGPHNPFLFGAAPPDAVEFELSIPGLTADSQVIPGSVVFSFGTAPGNNVGVPLPPSAFLMGSGLLGLLGLGWRRKVRS